MVNSKTYGFSEEFTIKGRTDEELKELNIVKQRKDIEFHVEKFDREYRLTEEGEAPAYLDGGLLLLTLGRPSFGIGKDKINSVLLTQPELLSEQKMTGEAELSQQDTVNLLLACAEKDAIFYRSLHRRLPRMSKKMRDTYSTFVKKRDMLKAVFEAIDVDKGGAIDQDEMQQFFDITGGSGRKLMYSDAQLALMTDEDKELLLQTDNLTSSMDLSGDGVLVFSEFMRFFLGNNPDGSAKDLEENLQDLGYLQDGKPRKFEALTEGNIAAIEAAPVELPSEEDQKAIFAKMMAGAHAQVAQAH